MVDLLDGKQFLIFQDILKKFKFRQLIVGNLLQAAPEEGQAAQPPAEVSPRGFEKLHDGTAI